MSNNQKNQPDLTKMALDLDIKDIENANYNAIISKKKTIEYQAKEKDQPNKD